MTALTPKHVAAPVTGRRPKLIIVHGAPGAGKTTVARQLGRDLGVAHIGRDDLKEFFFDRLGIGDREWSSTLGRMTSDMLYPLMEQVLTSGRDLVLENAFYADIARPRLRELLERLEVPCLEVYVELEADERRRRFIERNENGTRHAGHVDGQNYNASDEAADRVRYAPLAIGELWKVDTTHFKEQEYNMLRDKLAAFLNEQT